MIRKKFVGIGEKLRWGISMKVTGETVNRTRERNLAKGKFLFQVTEDILVAMEDLNINRTELAQRLGKRKPQISKLLQGSANMTLGTLSDIAFELNLELDKTFKEYSDQRIKIVMEDNQQGSENIWVMPLNHGLFKAYTPMTAGNEDWYDLPKFDHKRKAA